MKEFLGVVAILGLASCGPREARGPKVHEGLGTIVALESDHVTLDHEDIPGFMKAMTMSFPVKDSSILPDFEEGMRVRFRIEVDGSSYAVVAMEPISSR